MTQPDDEETKEQPALPEPAFPEPAFPEPAPPAAQPPPAGPPPGPGPPPWGRPPPATGGGRAAAIPDVGARRAGRAGADRVRTARRSPRWLDPDPGPRDHALHPRP